MSKQNGVATQNKAKESEALVIGTVFKYNGAFEHIADLIENADVFQELENRIVWGAIATIAREQRQIDIVSLLAQLRLSGGLENPAYTLSSYPMLTHVGSGLREHAMRVVENYIRLASREICKRYGAVNDDDLNAADPFTFNERIVEGLTSILNQITKVSIKDTKQVMAEFVTELNASIQAVQDGARIVGWPTGLNDLDEVLGGFKPQKLYLLAARPAMGKSAFGCCHSPAAIAESKTPTGIVSTEMGRVELMGRIVARNTGIDSFTIQNGTVSQVDYQKISEATGKVERMPIFIEDHNHSMITLISCIRQMVRRHGCKVIFVDYIQRIMADKGMSKTNKNELVGYFAKALKSIAKELDVAIVALAQLSREVEKRPTKIPQLSDLRDSGELEQEADVVIFMYRPSYYKQAYFMQQHTEIYQFGQSNFDNEQAANEWLSSLCYFEVAKHRGGKIGRFWSKYSKKTSLFTDISKDTQKRMGGDQMDAAPEVLRGGDSEDLPF